VKTSIPAATFLVAPLSAALLALGVLLLPGFGAPHPLPRVPAAAPVDSAACTPKKGGNPATCKELVELQVRDVIPLTESQTHAVVLTTADGQLVLPIFVDESAAVAIAFRLAHLRSPQPLSQDLLGSVVSELGAKVTEVRIDDLQNDIYLGRVFLEQGERKMTINARPSDSIAMALDGQARIRVTRKVLDEAGISRGDIDALREGGPGVGGSGPAEPRTKESTEDRPAHRPSLKLTPDRTQEIRL
jgi:bifunctional DNase/RNase